MEVQDLNTALKDWEELSEEYKTLEATHQEYVEKLEKLGSVQRKCIKELNHQRYRITTIKQSLKKMKLKTPEERERVENLERQMMQRKAELYKVEQALPKENGLYLKIILGNVNVSILNEEDKFKYKDEYEKFKLILSLIGAFSSLVNLLTQNRVLDLLYTFLLVWYYCTLTIRESILRVNGSRIKGWWRMHHFISTVLSGIILVWPTGTVYYMFRRQFMIFNVYINFVQYLQFRYQRGCLYRLKTLGERYNMDITIEGFHSWMWRGLSFLLPFLYVGYAFQLYNAWILYQLSFHEEATWQVPAVSFLFFVLFLGNTVTTSMVIPQKLREKVKLKYRFAQLDKYFNQQRTNGRKPSARRVPVSENSDSSDSSSAIIEDSKEK